MSENIQQPRGDRPNNAGQGLQGPSKVTVDTPHGAVTINRAMFEHLSGADAEKKLPKEEFKQRTINDLNASTKIFTLLEKMAPFIKTEDGKTTLSPEALQDEDLQKTWKETVKAIDKCPSKDASPIREELTIDSYSELWLKYDIYRTERRK